MAQAAHSGPTRVLAGAPRTVAPGAWGWARACARAAAGGVRSSAAVATAALSMTRLTTMSVTSAAGGTGSAASSAIFQASLVLPG